MNRWIFCRMSRVLIIVILLGIAAIGNSQTQHATRIKHYALYAPHPEYPLAARKHHWTGAGIFACYIRPDGTVASVDVLRSTGHQTLDQAAITAFRQWRFHPGDMKGIKIPINFSMNRMSGAVISD